MKRTESSSDAGSVLWGQAWAVAAGLRRPTIAVILACASLWFTNQNFWALAALPVILGVSFVEVPIPWLKWFFMLIIRYTSLRSGSFAFP